MKVRYQRRLRSLSPFAPLVLKPLIEVDLTYQNRSQRVWALVDSGADVSIFDASIAQLLDVPLTAGLKQTFKGITGETTGYFHEVSLQPVGLTDAIKMPIAFAPLEVVSGILGQADFFQNHSIAFQRYNDLIEIKPAKDN